MSTPETTLFFKLKKPIRIGVPKTLIRLPRSIEELRLAVAGNSCISYGYGPQAVDLDGRNLLQSDDAINAALFLKGISVNTQSPLLVHGGEVSSLDSILQIPGRETKGDSGGPVVCRSQTGEHILVAINRAILDMDFRFNSRMTVVPVSFFEVIETHLDWIDGQMRRLSE